MNSWDDTDAGRAEKADALKDFHFFMKKLTLDDRAPYIGVTADAKQKTKTQFARGTGAKPHFYLQENGDAPEGIMSIPDYVEICAFEGTNIPGPTVQNSPKNRGSLVSLVLRDKQFDGDPFENPAAPMHPDLADEIAKRDQTYTWMCTYVAW